MEFEKYSELLAIVSLVFLHFFIIAREKWTSLTTIEKVLYVVATIFGVSALITQGMKLMNGGMVQQMPLQTPAAPPGQNMSFL